MIAMVIAPMFVMIPVLHQCCSEKLRFIVTLFEGHFFQEVNVLYFLAGAIDMSYDFDKMPERKRKTKRVLNEPDMERKSTLSIR